MLSAPARGDIRHVALWVLDHQMRIDDRPGRVDPVGDGSKNDRSKADRGDEVTIHDVDLDAIGSGQLRRPHLIAETSEVGRQDGGYDADLSHAEIVRQCARMADLCNDLG